MYIFTTSGGGTASTEKRKYLKMSTLTQKTTKKKKLTLELIIEYAQKNGLRYDAYTPFTDRWGELFFNEPANVGIELKKNVWFWFEIYPKIEFSDETGETYKYWDPSAYVFFQQRYNCNNGHIMKSFKQGYKAQLEILNN